MIFEILAIKAHHRAKKHNLKVYCYKKADFNGLRETLIALSFDDCLVRFQDIFFSTVDKFIPQVMLRHRSRPPWMSNEIMKDHEETAQYKKMETFLFLAGSCLLTPKT